MKKKLFLLLMAILATIPNLKAATVTYYFDFSNSGVFLDANAIPFFYYWGGSASVNWPGVEMSKLTDNIYKYEGTDLLFTDFKIARVNPNDKTNSNQWGESSGFKKTSLTSGHIYSLNTGNEDWEWTSITDKGTYSESPADPDITIYINTENNTSWGQPYVYKYGTTWGTDDVLATAVSGKSNLYQVSLSPSLNGIVIRNNNKTAQTTDIENLSDGTTYYILSEQDNGKYKWSTTAPSTEPEPSENYTVYANVSIYSGWGTPYAYCWSGGDNNGAFPGVEMTHLSGDIYYYTTDKKWEKIIIANEAKSYQTGNLDFNDGYLYTITGMNNNDNKNCTASSEAYDGSDSPVTPTPDLKGDGYVYFNAGAKYYTWKENIEKDNNWKDKEVKIYAYYFADGGNDPVNTTGRKMDNLHELGITDAMIFRDKIPTDGKNYTNVTFVANIGTWGENEQDGKQYYFHGKDGQNYESSLWDVFVYGPGDSHDAHQSYLTFAQYQELSKHKDKNGLYFIGNSFGIRTTDDGDFKTVDNWTSTDAKAYVKADRDSDGIYVVQIQNTSGNQKFKVSYVNPGDFSTGRKVSNLRSWATFNLGIIGAPFYTYSNGIQNTVANTNDEYSTISINTTFNYNYYSQFDWLIPSNSNTMYLVIDAGVGYTTACLLDFNPMPSLSGTTGTLVRNVISGGYKADDHPGGYENGNEVVTYTLGNQLSADFTFEPAVSSNQTDILNQFSFTYSLVNKVGDDYKLLGNFKGATGETKTISLTSIPYGSNDLYCRAYYTDKDNTNAEGTPLVFRSRISKGNVNSNVVLKGLEAGSPVSPQVHNLGTEPGKYDLVFGYVYEFPSNHPFSTDEGEYTDGGAAIYPAFEATIQGRECTGYVIPANYTYLKAEGVRDAILGEYTWGGDDSSTVTEDWCAKSALSFKSEADKHSSGYLPLYIPNAITQEDYENKEVLTVELTLYACYPFQVSKTEFEVSEYSAEGRKMVIRKAANATLDDVTTVKIPTTTTFTINTYSGMSSIMDVNAPVADRGEGVLYTLQGVRVVDANPAAGVYIRRFEDGTARKEVVR